LWSVKHELATGLSAQISRSSGQVMPLGVVVFFFYVFFFFVCLFVCFPTVAFSFTQFVSGFLDFNVTSGDLIPQGAQLTVRGGGFLLYRYWSLVYFVCQYVVVVYISLRDDGR
jgi:hypothetical protein